MLSVLAWWRARGIGSNRARLEREMQEEMRFHQEMEAADLAARGMAPQLARRTATLTFGSDERFKEEAREAMALRWLRDFRIDTAFALRSLRRSPGFTIVAVVALGIGIGVNATVFGLVDSFALTKLPIREPDQLVAVFAKERDGSLQNVSYSTFEELRAKSSSFSDAAAFTERAVSIGTSGGSIAAWAVHVSDNYFTLQGIEPAHGRFLHPGDQPRRVAVISDDFWKRQLAADPRVVGKTISIGGAAFTIVGIAPRQYHGTRLLTYDPSIWLPVGTVFETRRARFNVIARLRNNASLAGAEKEANAVGDLRFTLLPNSAPINPWLAPRERIELVGRLLIAGVCLVLIVACADVASLLLARMTVRRHELSVRLALGASRTRLLRQLATESLVLALIGALASLPLAFFALKASVKLLPPLDFTASMQPVLSTRVVVITLIASVLSAIAFGLAPVLQFRSDRLNPDPHSPVGLAGPSGGRVRAALVVSQVAISVVVLIAAGLSYRGLRAARAIDVGFDVPGAVVFTLDPALIGGYDGNRIEKFYRLLEARLTALPEVQSVSRASSIPLDGNSRTVALTGGVSADYFTVGPNYFSTMGIRLVSGVPFSSGDRASLEPVVVNETLARRLWNGAPAVGRVFTVGAKGDKKLEVIGVARSEVSRRLGDKPRPILWRSLSYDPFSRLTVIVRTRSDTAALISRIPPIVRSIDPELPVIGLRTLGGQVELAYSAAENGAFIGTMFGFLAAVLAAGGLFGTLTYNISQRTREIGLRQALGANWSDILRLVTTSGIQLTLIGMSIALVAILFIPKRMSALIYGVSPHDPLLIAIASGLFLLIAAIASLGPALKALRIEPVEALRAD